MGVKSALFLFYTDFYITMKTCKMHNTPETTNSAYLSSLVLSLCKVWFKCPFLLNQIQLCQLGMVPLVNKLLKWGQFDRANPTLKMLLASWTFYTILKGFRSFNAENLASVGQRAAKLPAIKNWEWFDPGPPRTRADWFECGRGRMADFFVRPPTLTTGNF